IERSPESSAVNSSEQRDTFFSDMDDLNLASIQALPCRRNLRPPTERVSDSSSDVVRFPARASSVFGAGGRASFALRFAAATLSASRLGPFAFSFIALPLIGI